MIQWLFTVRAACDQAAFGRTAVCAEPALIVKLKNYYGEDRIRVVESLLKGKVTVNTEELRKATDRSLLIPASEDRR